jgi:hypothetical protein
MTNSAILTGYEGNKLLKQLKPRSWEHFRDAAIYDKPSYDPKELAAQKARFNSDEVFDRIVTARRELERVGMGVHSVNPAKDIWQRNNGTGGPDYYSLNERNPEYKRNLASIFLPEKLRAESLYEHNAPGLLARYGGNARVAEIMRKRYNRPRFGEQPPPSAYVDISDIFRDPQKALQAARGPGGHNFIMNSGLFGSDRLVGGQQVITEPRGDKITGHVLDRWDITPEKPALQALWDAITSGNILSAGWRNSAAPASSGHASGNTNFERALGTAGRVIWDRGLRSNHPWVSQPYQFVPVQKYPDYPEYGLQFHGADGKPTTGIIDRDTLSKYLDSVHSNSLTPPE